MKQVQSFLGFASYYRQYIDNFATLSRPLYKLLSKDVQFEMTTERETAVSKLKQALVTAPVLGMPDFEKPFKLYVDASFDGLGTALHQEQVMDGRNGEVAICFISRQLRGAEARYGATQLECLCLVWALEKLHYYLDGCQFEVITDCMAIKSLINMKTPNRHILRWQLAIQEYRWHMTITHREGKNHTNADGLSRNAFPNDENNPASDLEPEEKVQPVFGIHVIDLKDEFFETVKKGYEKDQNIVRIKKILDGKNIENKALIGTLDKPYKEYVEAEKFKLCGELLYILVGGNCVIVLGDKETQMEVLKMSHDEILAGHLNINRTMDTVQKSAWWKDSKKDVEDYVGTCDTCQRVNKKTGKQFGLLQKIEDPGHPWEVINMDFVTGLPPAGDRSYNACLVVVDRLSRQQDLSRHTKALMLLGAQCYFGSKS